MDDKKGCGSSTKFQKWLFDHHLNYTDDLENTFLSMEEHGQLF